MALVFAHANMRDGSPDRLAHTYQRELSQGVALERVSVVKDTASALYDWKKLSLVMVKVFAAGPAGCEDWMKVLCTALQPWHLLVSARRL